MLPTHWKQEEEEGKANHRQTLNSLTPLQIAASSSCFPVRDLLALSLLLQTAKQLHPSRDKHHSQRRTSVPIKPMHTLPRAPS